MKYQDQLRLQKRRKHLGKIGLTAGAIFLLLALAAYALFFSSWFAVRAVRIGSDNEALAGEVEAVAQDWLDGRRWGVPRRANSWLLSGDGLAAILLQKFPQLDSVQIAKPAQHELSVTVNERRPAGIWCGADKQCFYFDKQGIAYEATGVSVGYIFTVVYDQRIREVALGAAVETAERLNDWFTARERLAQAGIRTERIVIPDGELGQFDIYSDAGWRLMFSHGTDLAAQIAALEQYWQSQLTPAQRAAAQYFDLRIPGRIYWK